MIHDAIKSCETLEKYKQAVSKIVDQDTGSVKAVSIFTITRRPTSTMWPINNNNHNNQLFLLIFTSE